MRSDQEFEIEVLEPRILLSADGLGAAQDGVDDLDVGGGEVVEVVMVEDGSEVGGDEVGGGGDLFDGGDDGIEVAVEGGEASEVVEGERPSAGAGHDISVGVEPVLAGGVMAAEGQLSGGEDQVSGSESVELLVATLRAANGPPAGEGAELQAGGRDVHLVEGFTQLFDRELVLNEGGTLSGTGAFDLFVVNKGGVVAPGNSPGVLGVASFDQDGDGTTIFELGGTAPGNTASDHDQINVSGDVSLDGTARIELFGGFVPAAGDTFVIMTWTGALTGEFDDWQGTVSGGLGSSNLAIVPTYNANDLTLTVVDTSAFSIVAPANTAFQSGIDALDQVTTALASVGQLAEDIPLIGQALSDVANAGTAMANAIEAQLMALFATLPNQAEVTETIEGWDGTSVAGFDLTVGGILGHYGATDFSWDVFLTLTPSAVNGALEDVAGAVLGAVFSPAPTVDIAGAIDFDFSFGVTGSTNFYVGVEGFTARATAGAVTAVGTALNLAPPGGPISMTITAASVTLDVSVTAVPDASILDGSGHILLATLQDIAAGTINVADAFNLQDAGTLDASLTLDGNLTGFAFAYAGTHTLVVHSDDVFGGVDPDVTMVVDGMLVILGQEVNGVFTLKKTATETVIEAASVSMTLVAGVGGGAQQIIEVNNGTGKFLVVGDELAGTASLDFATGPALPNVSMSGTAMTLLLNTTGSGVTEIDGDTVDLPAGPYLKIEGTLEMTLAVPDVVLSGDFAFEQKTSTGGDEVVVVGANDLSFTFSGTSDPILQVTNGTGAFAFTDSGLVGTAAGDVMVALVGITVNGTFTVALNDTNAAFDDTISVNGVDVAIDLPAGPYLRVSGDDATLDVLGGVVVTGDFVFEQRETGAGDDVVTVSVSEASIDLGTVATGDIVQVSSGAGTFIITDDGIAGTATANVALGVAGVSLTGTFGVVINTTEALVDETVDLGAGDIDIDAPSGPYLRVSAENAELTVLGVGLSGDFSFEQRETEDGDQLVTVTASEVEFDFGSTIGSVLSMENGDAVFLITDAGVVGSGEIEIGANLFGETFTVPVPWAFNTTGSAVAEEVNFGGTMKTIDVGDGPFIELVVEGIDLDLTANGLGLTVGGNFVFRQVDETGTGGEKYVAVGVSGFWTTLDAGIAELAVTGGTGAFKLTDAGIAGIVAVETATLSGVGGIGVVAESLKFEINNTLAAVAATTVSISSDPADDVVIEFTDAYYFDYVAIQGTATIETGIIDVMGTFRIEKSESEADSFKVAAEDVRVELVAGTHTVASFHNGSGVFVFRGAAGTGAGFAGEATLEFDVGMIAMSGTIMLEVNTSSQDFASTVNLPGGGSQAFSFAGAAEQEFLNVCVVGTLNVGSVALPFSFTVELSGGNVVVETKAGSPLLTVDSSGAITLDPSITGLVDNFAISDPFQYVSLLTQLVNYLMIFQGSDLFDVEVPFTNKTLGEVFDWAKVVIDEIFSHMVGYEFGAVRPVAENGDIGSAEISVKVDGVLYTVSGISTGGAYVGYDDLVLAFNNAFAGVVTSSGTLADLVVARMNESNRVLDEFGADFPQFVISLTPAAIAAGSTLELVGGNAELEAELSFPEFDGSTDTAELIAQATDRYTSEEFINSLANLAGISGGIPYNEATKLYTFDVKFLEYILSTPDLTFDFGESFGPLAGIDLSGSLSATLELDLEFTIGFDLNAADTPVVISSPLVPVPSTGRISADSSFEVFINADVAPLTVTLSSAATSLFTSVEELADYIDTQFGAVVYGVGTLADYLDAMKAGSGLAIKVKDAHLGAVNRVVVRALQDDVFATELGFGNEVLEVAGTGYFSTTAVSPIKGLFLEGASFEARLQLDGDLEGGFVLGFVEVDLGTGNNIGTINPYPGMVFDADPGNAGDAPLTVSIDLRDQTTGETRFYLSELLDGLEISNIVEMIDGPNLGGSLYLGLSNITVEAAGIDLLGGDPVTLSIWIPDITDLNYNEETYDGTNSGVFVTYPQISGAFDFSQLSFSDLINALKSVAEQLSELSAFGFLDEELPFVNISINDMLDYAARFAEIIDAVGNGDHGSLQEVLADIELQIELLFDIDPDVFALDLDDGGIAPGDLMADASGQILIDPDGSNNSIKLNGGAGLSGSVLRLIGGGSATPAATWDAVGKILSVSFRGGETTAQQIMDAVDALAGPWSSMVVGGSDGTGTLRTGALKFSFALTAGYAKSLPFSLDLQQLVGLLGADGGAAASFLEAATTLVQISGEGQIDVSANASLQVDFGLDFTNPLSPAPFFYDTTAATLTASVLGSDLDFEVSLGSVVGIFVKEGTITLDRDGNPNTTEDDGDGDPTNDDVGAVFQLGLNDSDGDDRLYFDGELFSLDAIRLRLDGGVSAVLPVFAPTAATPLGSTADEDGDGYADNALVVDLPDLWRLFANRSAEASEMELRLPGGNNNLLIMGSSTDFEVEVQEGGATMATFTDNTLSLTIDPKTSDGDVSFTSGNSLEAAIDGVTGFSASLIAPDPTEDPNPGTGPVTASPVFISTPDFASMFDDLDFCDLMASNAGLLLDGLDSLLGSIQEGLEDAVANTRLPLIGNGLGGVAGFIDDFRSGLLADLRQAIEDAGGNALTAIENAIKSAFWDSLGPGGINILVDPESGGALDDSLGFSQLDVVLDCDDGLVVDLRLASAIALVDTSENPIDFDIGVPGFGLEVDGNVKVSLGFDLKFGFGLSPEDGFFFNSSATADDPELRVFFLAEVPALAATGELFFLQLAVTDSEENPSFFEGHFEIDLMDPNGDGKLTFAEMSGSGVTFGDIVSANLSAEADVNLDLRASFGGNTAFPTIVAKFHLGWMWDLQDGAGEPVVEIRDLGLDLGSFISDFLEPVLAEIRKVTEPLDPVIEFVTARIPVLSDIAGETITMLDLAEAFGLLEPSTRDFIENVATVIQLINDIPTGSGSLIIPFGSISLQDDGSGNRAKVQQLQDIAAYTLDELGGAIEADPGAESYSSAAAGFASDAGSLDNFSIPVFDNPSELFNLFTGGSIRLVEWRMPEFKFEFVYTQSIPIYPPLYAKFGGRVAAMANIGFGYDTYGIQKFIASEDKNPLDIFDGFYIMDFDANGNEQFELELVGEIFAGVSINLTLVEVGVTVGFSLSIGFDLNDVNDDGRVRVSEIISLAQIDPRCLFNITLTGSIFLEAFLIVDLFFFSVDKTWRFAEITLFEIELSCPEPVLAQHGDDPELAALGLGAGDLVLNAGSRAIDRDEIDTTDGAETFIVKHVADEGGGKETVVVEWGSWNQEFKGVEKIWVMDGGAGDDHFSFSGVTSTVEASGGVGNDTIILSDGANSVANGDSGNDVITASVHENATGVTINGGAGKDLLTGGSKGITINGGAGADEITGTDDLDTGDVLNGDEGDDNIVAGKGDDQVDGGAGNDTIEGGVGDDVLFGGTGADTIRGSRGNDVIYAGEGSDSVKGGVDNDLLVGGSGDDRLDGHGGIDLIIGDDALSVNGFSIATATDASNNRAALLLAVAGIPTGTTTVEELTGSGDDFMIGGGGGDFLLGGEGNDFMFGGNFYADDLADLIEEDGNDFFDGGGGDDEIFGDDAFGQAGERNTGIAIQSVVFLDANNDGIKQGTEIGVQGVVIELRKWSDPTIVVDTTESSSTGNFKFPGLDPNSYLIRFSLPSGYTFSAQLNPTDNESSSTDSDVDLTTVPANLEWGETGRINLSSDEINTSIAAGYVGNPEVLVDHQAVEEGNVGETSVTFTVELSNVSAVPLSIDYATADNGAEEDDGDYIGVSGTLEFAPGQLFKAVTIQVYGDGKYEPHEGIDLVLTLPAEIGGGTITKTATIINDDGVPGLSVSDFNPDPTYKLDLGTPDPWDLVYPTVPIYDEGGIYTFTVSLSHATADTVTVEYRTNSSLVYVGLEDDKGAVPSPLVDVDGTPDFISTSGSLTFLPGETEKTFNVAVLDDAIDELEERFLVELFNPTFATIADGTGYGIITDDDDAVSVTIRPAGVGPGVFTTAVLEGDSGPTNVDLEVVLSGISGRPITVNYATANGTANESPAEFDYIGLPNDGVTLDDLEITFLPGQTLQTITVQVEGDTEAEDGDPLVAGVQDEYFFVNLLTAEGADIARVAGLESNHVTVTITEDDLGGGVGGDGVPHQVYFSSSEYVVHESEGMVEITLIKTAGTGATAMVVSAISVSATAGADFDLSDFTPAGRLLVVFGEDDYYKQITIPITSDDGLEGEEEFVLVLQTPTGAPGRLDPWVATVTIEDGETPYVKIDDAQLTETDVDFSAPAAVRIYLVDEDGSSVNAPAGGIKIPYELIGLTATSATDFQGVSGVLTIAAATSEVFLPITVKGDLIGELTESFAVRLGDPTSGDAQYDSPGDRVGVVEIADNDKETISGVVFYDGNANGYMDGDEVGIDGVDVQVTFYQGDTQVVETATTAGGGLWDHAVFLGQVSIEVDGETVSSPFGPFLYFFGASDFVLTTGNETQSESFEGIVGISPFSDVGYRKEQTFSYPEDSDGVGRGGTDDTIFGGPGSDFLDGGAGDDFIVGGHWQTATDSNAPINNGNYSASVDAVTVGLHVVHDNGPIFEVDDLYQANAAGVISGEIWVDLDGNDLQGGGDPLLLEEVVVNLYDYKGNHVNSVVTTTGKYEFDGLYLIDGLTSKYLVEFDLPEGYKFVVGSSANSTTNSDVVSGSRTYKVELTEASPTNKRIDAGVEDAEAVPTTNASIFQFGDSSFSASGVLGEEVVEVTVVRADAQEARAVIYNTLPGTGADAALPEVNYEAVSGLLLFQVGELVKTFEVPVIPVLTLGICDTVHFNVFLREPTGRPVDEGVVYLYGDGEGELNDDDEIYGGDDWDLILGDSGSFRATDILTFPGALPSDLPGLPAGMVTRGGPGDDVISGGNSLDFIDAQLGDDVVYDGEGRDVVYLGLGDDLIDAQLDDDFYYGQHGSDVIISTRDMTTVAVSSPTAFGWVDTLLEHKDEAGVVRSTFYLNDFESVRLYGGAQDNTFDLSGWSGGAFVSGSGGNDSLVIENDTDMTVVNSTLFEGKLFQLLYGFFKQGAVLLPDSTSYHFGGIENVSLTGGAGDNTIDASAYSKGGITLEGKGGRDFLLGSQRDDVFLFDADDVLGFDSVEGNGGSDTLDFSATSGKDIEIDLSIFGVGNIQTVVSGRLALELLDEDLEVVIGGELNDTITGNTLDNVLHGGPGNDSLAGGAGSETYVFDTDSPWGIEQITENIADSGHDTLDFSGTSGFEIDLNMGILGTAQVINANLTLTLIGEGIEEVIGGDLDDTIRGNSNENTLRGGPGADLLDGKSGDDFLDGGEGDDDLDGGLGYDSIDESGNTNFTLNDGELARGNGEVDTLDDLEFVKLTGGISPNVFDLTGWSGDAELRGAAPSATDVALDRVVFGGDFSMVLTDVLLEVYDDFVLTTLLQSITLSGVDNATLAGGDSSNQIDASGFTGTTRLSGKGGDDTIVGGSAYDRIDGGADDDTLTGNLGNDRIIGGSGTDGLVETRNANFITGAGGIVVIGTESDLVTEIENATLTGGASANLFIVTGWDTGALTVDGAGGVDLLGVIADGDLTATDAAVTITDGALVTVVATSSFERVTLIGGNGDNSLDASGFSGRAALGGGDGDDTIIVGSGETRILAGDGDDTVVVGPSGGGVNEVRIEGGEGDDTLDFSGFAVGVSVDLSNTGVTQVAVVGDLELVIVAEDLENVRGGAGADTFVGNSLDNRFVVSGGGDFFDGMAGEDSVIAEADADMLLSDVALDVGGDVDGLISIEAAELTGGVSVNHLDASAFTGVVILAGEGGADVLMGSAGGTTFEGGEGDDDLFGLGGDDRYLFDVDGVLGVDQIDDTGGIDTVDFAATTTVGVTIDLGVVGVVQTVHVSNLALEISAGTVVEDLIGGEEADSLTGNAADNRISGGLGADVLDGVAGTNTLVEQRDADFVLTDSAVMIGTETDMLVNIGQAIFLGGESGNLIDASLFTLGPVLLNGGAGNDSIFGGAGDDFLFGGEGHDQLFGGHDSVTGPGTDNDLLSGGSGNDVYLIDLTDPQGADTIYEAASGGAFDLIVGAGGSAVDLSSNAAQPLDPNLTLTLSNLNVEFSL